MAELYDEDLKPGWTVDAEWTRTVTALVCACERAALVLKRMVQA